MRDLGIRLVVDDSQKSKFASIASAAARAEMELNSSFNSFGMRAASAEYALNRVGATASVLGTFAFGALKRTVLEAAGAFATLGSEFIKVNERFGDVQITLASTLRSFTAAKSVVNELASITAKSPIPFEGLAKLYAGLSAIPQTGSRLLQQANKGTLSAPTGFMNKSRQLVEAMQVFRPDQDIDSALFAIREALGGQPRSLIRRFDVTSGLISRYAGKSMAELKADPGQMFEAMHKMFTSIITPSATAAMARQPSRLAQNVQEQIVDIPLMQLGGINKKTQKSPYQFLLTKAQETFDQITEFMKGDFMQKHISRLQDVMLGSFSRIGDSFTTIFDKIIEHFGISGNGRMEKVVNLIVAGFNKIADFAESLSSRFANTSLVDDTFRLVEGVFKLAAGVADFALRITEKFGGTAGAGFLLGIPMVLVNFGTILKFLTFNLPNLFNELGKGIRGVRASAAAAVAEGAEGSFSGVRGILSRNRLGNSDAFSVSPIFSGNTLKGQAYQDYRATFARNAVLGGAMGQYLSNYSGKSVAPAQYNYLLKQWQADTAYINDPKNAGVIEALLKSGKGGNQLVGIGAAMRAEQAAMSTAVAPSSFSRFASGAWGMTKSIGTSMGVIGAITAAGYAIEKLIDAVNANTNAIEERKAFVDRTSRGMVKRADTPDLDLAAILSGSTKEAELARIKKQSESYSSILNVFGKMNEAVSNNKAPNIGNTIGIPGRVVNALRTVLPMQFGGMLGVSSSALNTGDTLTQLGGADAVRSFIDDVTKNVLTDKEWDSYNSRSLKNKGGLLGDFNTLYDLIRENPDIENRLKAHFDRLSEEITNSWAAKFLEEAGGKDSIVTALVRGGVNGSYSTKSPTEIAAFFNERSGVENVFSRIHAGRGILQNAAFSSAYEAIQGDADAFNPEAKVVRTMQELSVNSAELFKDLTDLNGAFEKLSGDNDATVAATSKWLADFVTKAKGTKLESSAIQMASSFEQARKAGNLSIAGLKTDVSHLLGINSPNAGVVPFSALSGAMLGSGPVADALNAIRSNDPEALRKAEKRLKSIASGSPSVLSSLSGAGFLGDKPLGTLLTSADGDAATRAEAQVSALNNVKRLIEALDGLARKLSPELGEENLGALQSAKERLMSPVAGISLDIYRARDAAVRGRLTSAQSTGNGFWLNPATMGGTTEERMAAEAGFNTNLSRSNVARGNLFSNLQSMASGEKTGEINRQIVLAKQLREITDKDSDERLAIEAQINQLYVQRQQIAEAMKPSSFFYGIMDGMATAKEELWNFAAIGQQVGQTIKSSFGNAFADIALGTESVSDAFRNMAKNIIAAMAQIFANQFAASLLGMLLPGFIKGAVPGAANPAANAGSDPTAGGFYKSYSIGGPIHGGTGIRDDVPILAMGGEFVLNKRAVQEIGLHNLERWNSGSYSRYATGGSVGYSSPSSGGYAASTSPRNVTIHITIDSNSKVLSRDKDGQIDMKKLEELSAELEATVDRKIASHLEYGGLLNPNR